MKRLTPTPWHAAPARACLAVLLALLGGVAGGGGQADPCGGAIICGPGGVPSYHLQFDITSTTPVAITGIVDLWGGRNVADGAGDFLLGQPPQLPTGSGTLDAGQWAGEDAHFLLGMAGASLVFMMNPATAALMTGRNFDDLVNGITQSVPNPHPVSNAEGFIISRMANRPPEWEHDIWSLFDTTYRPNALDPTLLVGPGSTTGVLMSFTDGKVLGTVNITATPVPEPGSWALMLAGACGLAGWLRRRRC